MTLYCGKHADWYDIFYADKPYWQEAQFVDDCLRKYGEGQTTRLLELACGTGTHALLLGELGYEIVAVDSSPDMIARARTKAIKASAAVEFHHQDMRSLSFPETHFDAAICLFDSIGYVITNDGVDQVLRNVHRHLRPMGLFVVEYWHAAAMLRNYDPVRIRRWATDGGELLRISETELHYDEEVAAVTYSIYDLNSDGSYYHLEETHTNRYFSVQEMAHLLSSAGFTQIKCFAGFTADERISDQTWHVVALAQKQK